MSIIAFIVIGLLAGLIARALMPGRQSMGLIATTLLGMAGSLVGGFVGSLLRGGSPSYGTLHSESLIASILGALVVLFLVGLAGRGRRRATV